MTRDRIAELRAIFATGKRSEVIAAGEECLLEFERRARTNRFPGVKKTIGYSLEEVKHYAQQRGWSDERAETFHAHYEMVGWVYGRSKHQIKCLTAAMRTWEKNDRQRNGAPVSGTNGHGIGSRFGVGA